MDLINTILPLDVLRIILHFIDTISDSFNALLVCRKWYTILIESQNHWKCLALDFWHHKENHNYAYKKYVYDLEWAQAESGKEWLW
jgi:hypothetical protein